MEHRRESYCVGTFPPLCQRWRLAAAHASLAGRRLAVRWAAAAVTLTEKDRQQYLTHLPCRAPVLAIPNPVTIAHEKRAKLDSRVVLATGRLVAQKGFDLLLDAWAQVIPRHPEWRLRIVGSGPDEASLKSQARGLSVCDHVDFIPNTVDMASEFQSASIFVLSSRFEGFGLVVVEAKSFGLPVVSFDCDCGPSDILRHEQDGLLVAKEDVRALAAALDRLMSNDSERESFGQSAFADSRFDSAGSCQIGSDYSHDSGRALSALSHLFRRMS